MNILLLGSGGREHALAWKIAQSPRVEKLYIAPGNAGTSAVGENVAISVCDFEKIAEFVRFFEIKLRKSLTDWKQYVTIRNAVVTN